MIRLHGADGSEKLRWALHVLEDLWSYFSTVVSDDASGVLFVLMVLVE